MDVLNKGVVTWNDCGNYLLLENYMRNNLDRVEKELLGSYVQFVRTEGRDSIRCILLIPFGDVETEEKSSSITVDTSDCRYATCSRDGVLNLWTSNFTLSESYHLASFFSRGTSIGFWVTAAEVIVDSKLIVVATTNFCLYFFRYNLNNEFEMVSKVEKLPGTILCLSYHKDEPPSNSMFLTWGDEHGGLGVITFKTQVNKTFLGSNNKDDIHKKIKLNEFHFTDLSNNHLENLEARYMLEVHKRFVCQVRYIPKLHGWVSCSKDTCTALFVGDLVPSNTYKNRIYFSVVQGVNVFEYCERLGFIVTAGSDTLIRLWNPMSKGQKLVGVFRGHVSPVTHMVLDQTDNFLVTISEGKEIRVFDMAYQRIIQKVKQSSFRVLGKKPVTAVCMNKKSNTVILASNMKMAVIESKEEYKARHSLTTLNAKISCALFNYLYNQIVTGDWKSQVIVWDLFTGHKTVQYTAHSVTEKGKRLEVEIKSMCFDSSWKRLVTGHRRGIVKIWNYNIGVLLKQVQVPGNFEVTCIRFPLDRLIMAGTSKTVYYHVDKEIDIYDCLALKPSHPLFISQLEVSKSYFIASSSFDGTVNIFNLFTGLFLFTFFISSENIRPPPDSLPDENYDLTEYFNDDVEETQSFIYQYFHANFFVENFIFLNTRLCNPNTANLLTIMHPGFVLAWSLGMNTKCLGNFRVISHKTDLLHSGEATQNDEFLVVGTSSGYMKVFDISHYFNPEIGECSETLDKERKVIWEEYSFVRLRQTLQLFYNPESDFSKKMPSHLLTKCHLPSPPNVHEPHLINSFRGHDASIVCIKLVEAYDRILIVSSGSDMSVRVWTIQGLILGILGQLNTWFDISIFFLITPTEQMAIKGVDKKITYFEKNEKALSAFYMTRDEVKPITYKEKREEVAFKFIRPDTNNRELAVNFDLLISSEIEAEKNLKTIESEAYEMMFYKEESTPEVDSSVESTLALYTNPETEPDIVKGFGDSSKMMAIDQYNMVRKKQGALCEVPSDLKRVGSYTTLVVLSDNLNLRKNSKWSKVRNAVVWIVNYLREKNSPSFTLFTLPKADGSKVGVFSNNMKEMIKEYQTSLKGETQSRKKSSISRIADEEDNLLRPLTPLSSQVFGPFYSEPYTSHKPIVPLPVVDPDNPNIISPYKKLPLATISTENLGEIKGKFDSLDIINNLTSSQEIMGRSESSLHTTSSKKTLIKNLNKTGWKLMSDGTIVKKRMSLNGPNTDSYLPPLLVHEKQVKVGVKSKGEKCFNTPPKPRKAF